MSDLVFLKPSRQRGSKYRTVTGREWFVFRTDLDPSEVEEALRNHRDVVGVAEIDVRQIDSTHVAVYLELEPDAEEIEIRFTKGWPVGHMVGVNPAYPHQSKLMKPGWSLSMYCGPRNSSQRPKLDRLLGTLGQRQDRTLRIWLDWDTYIDYPTLALPDWIRADHPRGLVLETLGSDESSDSLVARLGAHLLIWYSPTADRGITEIESELQAVWQDFDCCVSAIEAPLTILMKGHHTRRGIQTPELQGSYTHLWVPESRLERDPQATPHTGTRFRAFECKNQSEVIEYFIASRQPMFSTPPPPPLAQWRRTLEDLEHEMEAVAARQAAE